MGEETEAQRKGMTDTGLRSTVQNEATLTEPPAPLCAAKMWPIGLWGGRTTPGAKEEETGRPGQA
jgi:hypothetical protein